MVYGPNFHVFAIHAFLLIGFTVHILLQTACPTIEISGQKMHPVIPHSKYNEHLLAIDSKPVFLPKAVAFRPLLRITPFWALRVTWNSVLSREDRLQQPVLSCQKKSVYRFIQGGGVLNILPIPRKRKVWGSDWDWDFFWPWTNPQFNNCDILFHLLRLPALKLLPDFPGEWNYFPSSRTKRV